MSPHQAPSAHFRHPPTMSREMPCRCSKCSTFKWEGPTETNSTNGGWVCCTCHTRKINSVEGEYPPVRSLA